MTLDEAIAFALALPGAELSTSYGAPAVKANGNAFLGVSREGDTSFGLRLDHGVIAAMMDLYPETFWKTPHYEGYPAVLVRYDSPHDDVVRDMIENAHARAAAKPKPRPRKKT
jgi:hypothetical protein